MRPDTNQSVSEEINNAQDQVENPAATEEYLRSLPIGERMRAQILLDEQTRQDLKLNAQDQLKQWEVEARPKCDDYFGTANCRLVIIELEPSERCPFKFSKFVKSLDDVKWNGHYYGLFVNEAGYLRGGFHWVASHQHLAHVDGYVLNITKCWNKYPEEMGQENP